MPLRTLSALGATRTRNLPARNRSLFPLSYEGEEPLPRRAMPIPQRSLACPSTPNNDRTGTSQGCPHPATPCLVVPNRSRCTWTRTRG